MDSLVYGFIQAEISGLSVRWRTTGSIPMGDILEHGLGRLQHTWGEVSRIYWKTPNHPTRIEWYLNNSWRLPISQLWDTNTHEINIYFELLRDRVNPWEETYQNWIVFRDHQWNHRFTNISDNHMNLIRSGRRPQQRNTRPRFNPIDISIQTEQFPLDDLLQSFITGNTRGTTEFIMNLIHSQNETNQESIENTPLTLEEFNEIAPILKYEKSGESAQCAILQTEILDGMEIRCLPCSHFFIASAIEEWITQRNRKCPVCRNVVRIEE